MIATILFILCVVSIAYLEADADARIIALNQDIDHRQGLIERCIVVVVAGLLLCAAFGRWEWITLMWIPLGWSVFTPSFRWFLNRMRGMDWRYISTSNRYDRQFIKLTDAPLYPMADTSTPTGHAYAYNNSTTYRRMIHRAGAIAYAFEGTILLASLIIYFTNT